MAAVWPREATPPPVIGKAGRYTVFITPPPATPKTFDTVVSPDGASVSPPKASPLPVKAPPSPPPAEVSKTPPVQASPRIQVPPQQFEKSGAKDSGSLFGFFWDAIARVQDAHSSLDEYVAEWFGLNQSKYQWAIDDYYEIHGKEIEDAKAGAKQRQLVNKGLAV